MLSPPRPSRPSGRSWAVHGLFKNVREDERDALWAGFWGFFSLLCAYFLLLPFRDEAGVSVGTHHLPKLFAASLLLTLLATPLASFFLNRYSARELGLQQLYRSLSMMVLVFFGLYLLTGPPPQPPAPASAGRGGGLLRRAALERHELPGQLLSALAAEGPVPVGGNSSSSGSSEQRLAQPWRRQIAGLGAVAEAAEGQAARPVQQAAQQPAAPAALTRVQRGLRVAFFLSVSLLNLVAVSSWWARAADVFSSDAAARLFGILGAGATLGQLAGSLVAGSLVRAPLLRGSSSPTAPSLLPLLCSAAMLGLAGHFASRFHAIPLPSRVPSRLAVDSETHVHAEEGAHKAGAGAQRGGLLGGGGGKGVGEGQLSLRHTLASTAEGFYLIRTSGYLRHVCLFLVLNYIVSSFFYFEKSLVMATAVKDAASRTEWFAAVNSASAFCVLGLQLLATGPVLRYLGIPRALAITPAAAGLLMASIALSPTPNSVWLAEVLRKVLTYSLSRPAREVLFTVVTRQEKYKAKIFIDTVVQRFGDALAAGAFQTLDGALGLGPSGVALSAVPVCLAWAGVAHALGRRQEGLAARLQQKIVEASSSN